MSKTNISTVDKDCPWNTSDLGSPEDFYPTQYVLAIGYPILLLVCTVGNCLNIIVLSQTKPVQSIAVYLLAIAIGDLMTLWFQLPEYIKIVDPSVKAKPSFRLPYAYLGGFNEWMQVFSPEFSDWTLVIFSIERVLAVVKPLQFRDQQSAARARIIVLCTALYAALVSLSIPVMRYYTLSHGELDSYEGTVGNIFAKFPPWLETWNSVINMYMEGEIIVIFLLLLSADLFIIFTVIRSKRNSDFNLRKTQNNEPGRKETSGTRILVAAVTVYLFAQLPQVINETLGFFSGYPFCVAEYTQFYQVYPVVQTLAWVTYSANFYLYFAFSAKFRSQVQLLLQSFRVRFDRVRRSKVPARSRRNQAFQDGTSTNEQHELNILADLGDKKSSTATMNSIVLGIDSAATTTAKDV